MHKQFKFVNLKESGAVGSENRSETDREDLGCEGVDWFLLS